MQHALKQLLTILSVATLAACGNNSTGASDSTNLAKSGNASPIVTTSAPVAGQTLSVDAYRPAAATVAPQDSSIKTRDLSAAPTPTNILLGAPLASQTTAARQSNEAVAADTMGKPLQIGFGREVAQTATASATNQVLKWQATPSGGQVAAINFSSSGAKGMRVGLLVTQLPATATLRFYAKGETTAFEVKGADVLAVLAKNLAAGDTSNDARTYWSPVIKANNGTLEIEIPPGLDTNAVQISIPIISHFFMSMFDAQSVLTQSTYDSTNIYRTGNKSSQTCQIDVTCTTPVPAASEAVAWLVFNRSGGFASVCSGTLLNDNLNSATPYLLTANHCISTQTTASNVYTEFKYRALSCNNAATGEYFPTATDGASLLYTAAATDSTLLKLTGSPSTSVLFAGWDATTAPTVNTVIHGIHHPQGDQQRLSRGTISSYFARVGTTSMSNSNVGSGTILGIAQTSGNTEPGSSGSGLFKGTDANPVVIGQLFGRLIGANQADSCSDAGETRLYGRFDIAFKAGMSDWLVQGAKPVYRFYNRNNDSHFYTKSVTDSNYIKQYLTHYRFEGPAFNASSIASAGLSPVYRFYNTASDSHFFTISETERTYILTNLKHYRDEGIAWYAQQASGNGAIPLYRFYNTSSDVHFYTSSETDKDYVIANLKHFRFEGVKYYVQPLTP